MKCKRKQICLLIFKALLIGLPCLAVAAHPVDAFGFTMFGIYIGNEPQAETESVSKETENEIDNEHFYENHQGSDEILTEVESKVDMPVIIESFNSDPYNQVTMKSFSGDSFCIKTEDRTVPCKVLEDGTVMILGGEPKRCTKLKTTEHFLEELTIKSQNEEPVPFELVKENVKIPFLVQSKYLIASIIG